jgi:hypothetical protein
LEVAPRATAPCSDVAPPVIDGVWGCLIREPPEKDSEHRQACLGLSKATWSNIIATRYRERAASSHELPRIRSSRKLGFRRWTTPEAQRHKRARALGSLAHVSRGPVPDVKVSTHLPPTPAGLNPEDVSSAYPTVSYPQNQQEDCHGSEHCQRQRASHRRLLLSQIYYTMNRKGPGCTREKPGLNK